MLHTVTKRLEICIDINIEQAETNLGLLQQPRWSSLSH